MAFILLVVFGELTVLATESYVPQSEKETERVLIVYDKQTVIGRILFEKVQ